LLLLGLSESSYTFGIFNLLGEFIRSYLENKEAFSSVGFVVKIVDITNKLLIRPLLYYWNLFLLQLIIVITFIK